MKGIRKLLSLNLALIFLFTGFAATPAGAEEARGLERKGLYGEYIIVDGVEYDITQSPSGPGWKLYNLGNDYGYLALDNYQGGPIEANVSLGISGLGSNTITAHSGYGIHVLGDLYLGQASTGTENGTLTVSGSHGYAAICAAGTLTCGGILTASGGATSALVAKAIETTPYWPSIVSVGASPETATEGAYTGQNYINISYIPYVLTLDGNGGVTQDSPPKNRLSVSLTTGTPGYLHLYPYEDIFQKDDSLLLGWTDNEDGTGRFHARREEYKFPKETLEATVYACWEDETNKAVILNEYCGPEGGSTWKNVIACKKGETVLLPHSTKRGATFNGWLADAEGTLYPAGTPIHVTDSVSFTAQYTSLMLNIDGQEYPADEVQGNYENDWFYLPNALLSPILMIGSNYSGGPIKLPCSMEVKLSKSLTGKEGVPALDVRGDLDLYVYDSTNIGGRTICLTGSAGQPAISASGSIEIRMAEDEVGQLVIQGGEGGSPALHSEAGVARIDAKVYHAGPDEDHLALVGKYSGERYLRLEDSQNYSVTLSGVSEVPTVPENEIYTFYGWREGTEGPPTVWYKPGDTIDAGSGKTLLAQYLHENRWSVAVSIDGNGGKTAHSSNYFIQSVSSNSLSLYRLPSAEFTYPGYTLKDYNSKADGTGISYAKDGIIKDDGKTMIYEMYAQWEVAKDGGGGGGGGGGAAPADPIADAIKQAEKNGSVTLGPAASGKDVTLMAEHMGEILAKNLSVEIKTNTGSLKLPAETLAKLDKENTGKEIRITLEKGTDTDNISVGGLFLNFSVLAGSKEIHDVAGSARIRLDSVRAGDVVTVVHYNDDGTVKEVFFVTAKENGIVEFKFDGPSYYSLLLRSETPAYLVFRDVGEKAWYGKATSYAYQNKLFEGTSETAFSPNINMSREMFATVLYRLAGSPEVSGESGFTDVTGSGAYYYNAILWAAENKIINGYPDGRFGVGDPITREQMVAVLYRYAKDYAKADVSMGEEDSLQGYMDRDKISKGMYDAFRWAVDTGVLRGTTVTELSPQATATRAEVSQILMNYGQRK